MMSEDKAKKTFPVPPFELSGSFVQRIAELAAMENIAASEKTHLSDGSDRSNGTYGADIQI
ncbi:MAG: hypothetical protein ACYC27_14825 [Armatimonadota bacterium]